MQSRQHLTYFHRGTDQLRLRYCHSEVLVCLGRVVHQAPGLYTLHQLDGRVLWSTTACTRVNERRTLRSVNNDISSQSMMAFRTNPQGIRDSLFFSCRGCITYDKFRPTHHPSLAFSLAALWQTHPRWCLSELGCKSTDESLRR